jgi:hypothetical protein
MFKNDSNKYLLGALFRETSNNPEYVKFSLHESHPGLVNARKTFVELEDPTGYEWSMRYLGGNFEHWTRLIACSWFREAYDAWMLELNAKLKARYLAKIRATVEDEATPAAVRMAALKYLHTLDKPAKRSAGQPSKEEVAGELRRSVREAKAIAEDMERIGLKVV